jgi:two-component system sensor histidine kinase DegS
MYKNKSDQLDKIIKQTIESIDMSQQEIKEISLFAKKEFMDLEDEFVRLKIEASETIDTVEELEIQLQESKQKLLLVNKDYQSYSEDYMKKIYEETDRLRVDLAVQREKEISIIKRRNELELHLKSIRNISEKADRLSNDFEMAYGVLTGDLMKITEKIDDMQNKEIWGIKVIEAQEIERKRIARDMHDGPAQYLSNLIIKTELCIKLLDKDIDKTKLELQSLRALIRSTIDETRRLIFNLRPMSIDDLGLIPTLERFIDKISSEHDLDIELLVHYDINEKMADVITLAVYRIIQEAVNNVVKYAEATKVVVELTIDADNFLEVSVRDNGVGFDIDDTWLNLKNNKGFGISMMKERTNLLLGQFSIVSNNQNGTVISSRIPLEHKKGEKDYEYDSHNDCG